MPSSLGSVLAGYLFRLSRGDSELLDECLIAAMGLPLQPDQFVSQLLILLLEHPDEFQRRASQAIQSSLGRALPRLVFGIGSASLDSAHMQDFSLEREVVPNGFSLRDALDDPAATDEFARIDETVDAANAIELLAGDLARLGAKERQALDLKVSADDLGVTLEEIARSNAMSAVNLRQPLLRGRKKRSS